jgi:hypothetical protein
MRRTNLLELLYEDTFHLGVPWYDTPTGKIRLPLREMSDQEVAIEILGQIQLAAILHNRTVTKLEYLKVFSDFAASDLDVSSILVAPHTPFEEGSYSIYESVLIPKGVAIAVTSPFLLGMISNTKQGRGVFVHNWRGILCGGV